MVECPLEAFRTGMSNPKPYLILSPTCDSTACHNLDPNPTQSNPIITGLYHLGNRRIKQIRQVSRYLSQVGDHTSYQRLRVLDITSIS